MTDLLTLKDICFSYHTMDGEVPALSNISFSVKKGEFVSIVGPSGCGKSSLLNIIAGLLSPESGTIFFNSREASPDKISIGYMLQKDHLFQWRSVFQNTVLGLEIQGKLSTHTISGTENLLKKYNLYGFRNAKPSQLSGGMRQRAALIRTLALNPSLLILDEPFSALDYQTRLNVSDEIGQILRKEEKTALLVTHDIAEAVSMSDRVIILTKRPAFVRKDIPISLGEKFQTPLTARNSPEFKKYFNMIWKELNTDD